MSNFNVSDLIKIVMSSLNSKIEDVQSKIYNDEPILTTANKLSTYVPPEITEMRKLSDNQNPWQQTVESLFYEQGKLMESFEDDFDYHGDFKMYYPTYRSMNNQQLRGYFTWRSKVRKGAIEKTALPFVYIYIYELLNLIGVDSPEEAFRMLNTFLEAYDSYLDSALRAYTAVWRNDFIIYFNLDKSLLENMATSEQDYALIILTNYKQHSRDELMTAISIFSSYNVYNSGFFKKYPDDVKEIVFRIFDSLSVYYEAHRKKSFIENIFGAAPNIAYTMFRYAVFYDHTAPDDYTYEINPVNIYTHTRGSWSHVYYGLMGKNRKLGSIMKNIDCIMREKYQFAHPLKPDELTKQLTNIITAEIEKYFDEKNKKAIPKIEIDISKLHDIRKSSDIICEKLIVDDENEPEPESDEVPQPAVKEAEPSLLSETEYGLMQRLIYGGDFMSFIKEKGAMLSVVVDSVNEKLFDTFGDTVIIYNGEMPELIEDYTEELKGIVTE